MGKWLKYIGIASTLAFPLAVVMYRSGLAPFHTGFALIQAGAVIGALVFVVGLVFFIFARKSNPEGAKAALVGAVIAVIPVLPLAVQANKAKTLPFIHNVSTDIVNPPKFDKVAEIRSENDNPHEYNRDQTIGEVGTLGELQTASYPNVTTLNSDLSVKDAFVRAESLAKERGWNIVNVDADESIIEATETTLLWGFKDDIVIRVLDNSRGGSLVDLHSVSRFGGSDLGANAARIESFLADFSNR